jgi:hypothetical protein
MLEWVLKLVCPRGLDYVVQDKYYVQNIVNTMTNFRVS